MLPPPAQRESLGRLLLAGTFVSLLIAAYLGFHWQTHSVEDLRSAAEHLLRGQTHWITFQNRVLAPLLIAGLQAVTGWSWLFALYGLMAGCLATGAGLLLWRSRRDTGRSTRGLGQTAGWLLLATLFNHQWSYPWDFTGALGFLLLAIWAQDCFHSLDAIRSWWLTLGLVGLALNRESSLFVLAALALTALVSGWQERTPARGARFAFLCALAAFANILAVLQLRHVLFIAATRPKNVEGPEMTTGNFNQVRHNWNMLAHGDGGWLVAAIMLTLLAATAFLLGQNLRSLRHSRRLMPGRLLLGLCGMFGTGAILLFADTTELRVYLEFTPVWLLLATEREPSHPLPTGP